MTDLYDKIQSMTKDDKIQALELSINELRRMHDEVGRAYSHARTKVITFLGGGFALMSYLYGGGDLFIPKEVYGVILYFLGLFLCLSSISILLMAIQPVLWRMPTEKKIHKKMEFDDYICFLEYVRDEYVEALGINIAYCEKKQKYLNSAVQLLVLGAILLLVVKNFN